MIPPIPTFFISPVLGNSPSTGCSLTVERVTILETFKNKSHLRETPNLSTNVDISTNFFVSTGVQKEDDSIFVFAPKKKEIIPPPPPRRRHPLPRDFLAKKKKYIYIYLKKKYRPPLKMLKMRDFYHYSLGFLDHLYFCCFAENYHVF